MGSIPLCRSTLFATVRPVPIPWCASVEVSEAVTATFVEGLLPGMVFLGMRTRTPRSLNTLQLTLSYAVRVPTHLRVSTVDLPTILFRPLASASPLFPLWSRSALIKRTLLFMVA